MKIFARIKNILATILPHSQDAVEDSMSTQSEDPVATHYFRQSLLLIGGAFLVMLFFFLATFFLAVRGEEGTVVPNVVEQKLTDALMMLQERELYPRIQVKYTGNPNDKGLIISQSPEPGFYVKAGRRIILTVSRGAIIDKVEDFVGKNIEDVRGHLSSLFTSFEPLLVIREPVTFVFNEAPRGRILHQTPKADTPLSEARELILIVSRGISDTPIKVKNWIGWNTDEALASISEFPVSIRFEPDNVNPVDTKPRITNQTPESGTDILPGAMLTLQYSPPATVPEGFRYGLLQYTLPQYPVPMHLDVMILEPGKDDRTLFSMPYPGGEIAFPYLLATGSSIILMVNGEKEYHLDILPTN